MVDSAAICAYKTGALYDWAEWDQDKYLSGVSKAVLAKDKRFSHLKGAPYEGGYVVVIHTDEPILRFEKVTEFLSGHQFARPAHISRVFLLLSYDAARQRCPYVELHFEG